MQATNLEVSSKGRNLPELRFESHQLTLFSGLVIVQAFMEKLELAQRLKRAFCGQQKGEYRFWKLFLLLIVYRMLGFRRLRDAQSHREDPLIQEVVGLSRLPDVSTLSRRLRAVDERSVKRAHQENRGLVLDGLSEHGLGRLTLDFDGSVIGTRRHAEGSGVGFNPRRKGQRSYYPLLCTIAQSAQAFDFLHRPGNVHDSRGAAAFMRECIEQVRTACPHAVIECRSDSAFFNERIVQTLEDCEVEFSLSVPFERFVELKEKIEQRGKWLRVDEKSDAFELNWKPACWSRKKVRLLAIRTRQARQRKGVLQLDLFEPMDEEYSYQVVATNKSTGCASIMAFHHGRGSQEGVIGELKEMMNFDAIVSVRQRANELAMLASIYAHNVIRAMQMKGRAPIRTQGWKRPPCWVFKKAHTMRSHLLLRAGRITKPGNRRTLTISGNAIVAQTYQQSLKQLRNAA